MGLSPTVPDAKITAKETPPAFSPLGLRCIVLCAAHGLSLALPALQLSAVADRVLAFHTILPHRSLDLPLPGVARHRTSARWQTPRSERRHHRRPICENAGGVRLYPRIRRAEMGQRA